MKLSDLTWAIGELARAATARQHADCECHRRIAYPGPRAAQDSERRADADEARVGRREP